MSKALSALLSFALVLSLAPCAFASESPSESDIVSGEESGIDGSGGLDAAENSGSVDDAADGSSVDSDLFGSDGVLSEPDALEAATGSDSLEGAVEDSADEGLLELDSVQQAREELDALALEHASVLAEGETFIFSSAKNNAAVFDAADGGVDNGTRVQLYESNMTKAQRWIVSHDEKGYVTLCNEKSGLALDVANGLAKSGANAQLYKSNGTYAQKWIAMQDSETGFLIFVSALDKNLVLDAYGGSVANRTSLQIYENNGSLAQRWSCVSIEASMVRLDEEALLHSSTLADGEYVIQSSLASRKVVDVADGSKLDGGNAQLYDSNMTGAQRWLVSHDEKGYVIVTNASSRKCLDVSAANPAKGANVAQWQPNGTRAQKWIAKADENGLVSLHTALFPGLSLDVSNGSSKNGANLVIWETNGTLAQSFRFIPAHPGVDSCEDVVPEGYYEIVSSVDSNYALDVADGSTANAANVQLYARNGTLAQTFSFEYVEGYYQIKAAKSDKVLDVDGGNLVPTTNVQQWEQDVSNENQLFSIRRHEDGTFSFINVANGLVLDIAGGVAVSGANAWTDAPNDSMSQRFNLVERENLLSEGVYSIRLSSDGGKVLDVANGSRAEGANVQVYASNDTHAQKWNIVGVEGRKNAFVVECLGSGLLLTVDADGNVCQRAANGSESQIWEPFISRGHIGMKNALDGRVLDVANGSMANGANIQVYEANGTNAQCFDFSEASVFDAGMYVVQSVANTSAVLDVSDGSFDSGANVQLYASNDSGAQKWKAVSCGNGFFKFLNAKSGKALDVSDALAASGANVQQWEDNGSAAQRWLVEYAGEGGFRIVSALDSNLVLDAQGGSTADGTNIQIAVRSEASTQLFAFKPTTYVVKSVNLAVPCIFQYPELPNGCESVALTNALLYRGFGLSKCYLADYYIPRSSCDFVTCFWGNPHNSSGNCVSAPGITNSANALLRDRGSALRAYDVTGSRFYDLYAYLEKGNPVIIWTSINQAQLGPAYASQWYNGRLYKTFTNSHTVVLKGFDRDTGKVYLADSISGYLTCDADWINMVYTARGSQAVVIR